MPLQVVALYSGYKPGDAKQLRINNLLEGDQQLPVRLDVGDSEKWEIIYRELEDALRKERGMREVDERETLIPDDPSELTREPRASEPSYKKRLVESLRRGIINLLERLEMAVPRSRSFLRRVERNRLIHRLLFGTPYVTTIITVEDSLGNFYSEEFPYYV